MTRSSLHTMHSSVLALLAIGSVLAVATNSAHAQGFRRPAVIAPIGYNGFRSFAAAPLGFSFNNRMVTPATAQYMQSVRNNLQIQQAATRLYNAQPATQGLNQSIANFAAFNYIHSPFSLYPYGYYNPYAYGGYNPYYAQPFYGAGYGYGLPYGNGNYTSSSSSAPIVPAAPTPRVAPAIAGFGIPTNDDGTIAWPFAFRLMSPDAKRELLDPLAGELEILAGQASRGKANTNILRESQQNVDRLYQWLRTHRLDLAEGSVRDANAFLGRVDTALRTMRPIE